MSGGPIKTVIVYKTFPNEASARAAGFTIKGVSTRAGEKWGKQVVIQKKVKIGKAQVDDLASLLESMGMDATKALPVAAQAAQNPEVVAAPAFPPSNSSSVLGPSIFGAAAAAPAPAAAVPEAEAAPLQVDIDALMKLMDEMGLQGGKRKYRNKKQKKSRKQRKTKRKMTKRKMNKRK
jgi:hypothetical protein